MNFYNNALNCHVVTSNNYYAPADSGIVKKLAYGSKYYNSIERITPVVDRYIWQVVFACLPNVLYTERIACINFQELGAY